jgi:hypothetical protein
MTAPKKSKPNHRPLIEITADIHKAERANIFVTGKLLLEAKEQAGHGKWLPYLKSIGWTDRNAQLHMSVARLAAKYETIADLNAAPTALYNLAWFVGEAEEPDEGLIQLAIKRLRDSVARGDSAEGQRNAILLTRMADLNPGATELALRAASSAINQNCFGDAARYKSMEDQGKAILGANPQTEEELKAITDKHPILMPGGKTTVEEAIEYLGGPIVEDDDEDEDEDKDEEEAPLPTWDDPRKNLSPRQRAVVTRFDDACKVLLELSALSSELLAKGIVEHDDLDMLGNFLKQIAASKRKAVGNNLEIPECLRRAS